MTVNQIIDQVDKVLTHKIMDKFDARLKAK